MIIFSSIFGFGIGWGKPCPVNPYNLRPGPKTGMALVAAAGPVSNLVVATFIASLLQLPIGLSGSVDDLLGVLVIVNVSLAFFNLIPVPPLDGFSVLLGLLPDRLAYSIAGLQQYGAALLLMLIFFGQGFIGGFIRLFAVPFLRLIGYA